MLWLNFSVNFRLLCILYQKLIVSPSKKVPLFTLELDQESVWQYQGSVYLVIRSNGAVLRNPWNEAGDIQR